MSEPASEYIPLDEPLLARLASITDGRGIATVIAEPGEYAAAQVRAALRPLSSGGAVPDVVDDAVALTDPRLPGPAHALVALLGSRERTHIVLPVASPTTASIATTVDVLPLARAFDRARPVGVIDVRLDGVRIVEVAGQQGLELQRIALEEDAGAWHEMRGPTRPNPLRGNESSSQRDRFERRVEAHRARALAAAGARITRLAGQRGWSSLLVGGSADVVAELRRHLPASMVVDRHLPRWESSGQLAGHLAPEIDHAREAMVEQTARRLCTHGPRAALTQRAVMNAIRHGTAGAVLVDPLALGDGAADLVRAALAARIPVRFADGILEAAGGAACVLRDGRAA